MTLEDTSRLVEKYINSAYDIVKAVYDNLDKLTGISDSIPSIKAPVVVATLADVTLSGLQIINTVQLILNDRVAVTNQTNAAENGIYDAKSGAWVRSIDFDTDGEIIVGAVFFNTFTDEFHQISFTGTMSLGSTLITISIIPSGSSLTVQDEGTSLTTAATKFNFVGDGVVVTEPVANELLVTIATGISAATSEYCPGYTFVFSDTDTFLINGFDVTNLFNVGRRVKFSIGGVDIFGVILSRTFSTNTTINMTMEGGATLANVAYEVCFTAGVAAWSSIAGDPFSGTAINDITSGVISTTQWWFAVGDSGKIATSSDGGVTWTIRTTATSEDFLCCTYDTLNETFWAGARAGVLASTTDGTTIVEDTTSIIALGGSGGSDDITGIAYSALAIEGLVCRHNNTLTGSVTAYSTDQGATWTQAATGQQSSSTLISSSIRATESSGGQGPSFYTIHVSNTGLYIGSVISDNTLTAADTITPNVPTAMLSFFNAGVQNRILGAVDGTIYGRAGWTGVDSLAFAGHINGLAFSPIHERVVAVADNGELGYWDAVDKTVGNTWNLVSTGFNPTTRIMAVAWNVTDGLFIAVAKNGQICRSTNGTN